MNSITYVSFLWNSQCVQLEEYAIQCNLSPTFVAPLTA